MCTELCWRRRRRCRLSKRSLGHEPSRVVSVSTGKHQAQWPSGTAACPRVPRRACSAYGRASAARGQHRSGVGRLSPLADSRRRWWPAPRGAVVSGNQHFWVTLGVHRPVRRRPGEAKRVIAAIDAACLLARSAAHARPTLTARMLAPVLACQRTPGCSSPCHFERSWQRRNNLRTAYSWPSLFP